MKRDLQIQYTVTELFDFVGGPISQKIDPPARAACERP
jgi:hypothetical protein